VPCCDQSIVSVGQRARTMRLEFVAGDDFPLQLTFRGNLTGYTVEADVIGTTGTVLQTFAISTQYLTIGGVASTRYSLSLTRSQTTALASAAGPRWSFRWSAPGDKKRTIFIGRVVCVKR
jgi:hypothetical protein